MGTSDDDDFVGEFGKGGFVDWDGCHVWSWFVARAVGPRFKFCGDVGRLPGISANMVIRSCPEQRAVKFVWRSTNGVKGDKRSQLGRWKVGATYLWSKDVLFTKAVAGDHDSFDDLMHSRK